MTFYKFIVDTTTFMLSYSSFQFTLFGRLLDEPVTVNRIYYDNNDTFYVDADLDSFKLLVSNMRGYDINILLLEDVVRNKYERDVEYFITKDNNNKLTEEYSPVFNDTYKSNNNKLSEVYSPVLSEKYKSKNNHLNDFSEKQMTDLHTLAIVSDKNIITIAKLHLDSDNSFDDSNSDLDYDSV